MTEPKKTVTKKPAAKTVKTEKIVTTNKTATPNNPSANKNVVREASDKIFAKIGDKTGIDKKKVDEWQKKWLLVPETRTKYKHLENLPDVMGEELFAMTNDIIDFVQKEEGGKSIVFKKMKDSFKDFMSNPFAYLRKKAEESKKKMMEAKEFLAKKSESKPADKAPAPESKPVAKKTATKPEAAAKKPAKKVEKK